MADSIREEVYRNAIIDVDDMTITEYSPDNVKTYSLLDIIKRWNDVPNIEVVIRQCAQLPPLDGRNEFESNLR